MQGMFRNPMADPGILGVSSGAGLGAVTAIALGLTAQSLFFLPVFASVGSLLAAFIIFVLSSKGGRVPALALILSGLAVSMFISAITSMLLTSIHSDQVKEFLFWTTGGLSARRWEHAAIAAIPIITCTIILIIFARDLNVLMLGEEEAQAVGLNSSTTRKILLFLTSITTAAAICVSGSISFVGLIVPHIMRLIVGPDHRTLIQVSAIAGALFVVTCDLISRIILAPREIGVGIVTSLIGAPYFLFLLYRARKEGGAI
jgi:iron complex transport system permease protein